MLMVIFMMATGKTIKLMAMEYIVIWMEQGMKDVGKKINSMVKDLRPGLMELVTEVIM